MQYDVVIIGAGAAGMMCAIEAGKRGRRVMLLDHAEEPGEKIRISGGGRCNFTNINASPQNFISQNPHFCKSALSRYTPRDFIKLIEKYRIGYHEKTLGQLFCDNSAKDIITLLLREMNDADVQVELETTIDTVTRDSDIYTISTSRGDITSSSLVIATGGLSIPKMGATGFGYDIARQFGHDIVPTRAGLVPLTFSGELLALIKPLSGLSVEAGTITTGKTTFSEALLFTHRGLSGPSILQISSYWKDGTPVIVNLLPAIDIFEKLKEARQSGNTSLLHNWLSGHLPRRLAEMVAQQSGITQPIADLSDQKLKTVAELIHRWNVIPAGSEGYRTAEVTLGGVDTEGLSSKTMESKHSPGLYFIGEVVDVTGWLGGYNFQWAWASGWCAGQYC